VKQSLGDDALRIDQAALIARVWQCGTHKLWLRDDNCPADSPELSEEQLLALPDGRDVIRLRAPRAATLRFWRHRTPRPDSLAMRVQLRPCAGDVVRLRSDALPEQAHKPAADCLAEGFAAACAEIGCFPVLGFELALVAFRDDAPSSGEGIRLAAEHGLRAVLLNAYRAGDLPYL